MTPTLTIPQLFDGLATAYTTLSRLEQDPSPRVAYEQGIANLFGQLSALFAATPSVLGPTVPAEGRIGLSSTQYLYNNRVYNVRDFGATGDGNTDDTIAIQAALTAAATRTQAGRSGGGTVYVPPGSYVVTNLVLGDGVQLIGADRWLSYLIQLGGTTGPILKGSAPAQLFRVAHLCLDGNKVVQTSANNLIELDGNGPFGTFDMQATIEHCTLINAKGSAIWTYGSNSRACRIINCFVNACDGNGINLSGYDGVVTHCNIGASGLAGILLQGTNNTVALSQMYGSGRVAPNKGDGVLSLADRNQISMSTVQDNQNSGVKIVSCVGNLVSSCLADSNANAGFDLQDAMNVSCVGCVALDRIGGAAAHRYGLYASGTTTGIGMANLLAGSIAKYVGVAGLTIIQP